MKGFQTKQKVLMLMNYFQLVLISFVSILIAIFNFNFDYAS